MLSKLVSLPWARTWHTVIVRIAFWLLHMFSVKRVQSSGEPFPERHFFAVLIFLCPRTRVYVRVRKRSEQVLSRIWRRNKFSLDFHVHRRPSASATEIWRHKVTKARLHFGSVSPAHWQIENYYLPDFGWPGHSSLPKFIVNRAIDRTATVSFPTHKQTHSRMECENTLTTYTYTYTLPRQWKFKILKFAVAAKLPKLRVFHTHATQRLSYSANYELRHRYESTHTNNHHERMDANHMSEDVSKQIRSKLIALLFWLL